MPSSLKELFGFLSEQLLLSLGIFLVLLFVFMRLYEKFFFKSLKNKLKFLNNSEKAICFEIFLVGMFFLGGIWLIGQYYPYPFIWLLCSVLLVLGGALGLIPFSFIKGKNK